LFKFEEVRVHISEPVYGVLLATPGKIALSGAWMAKSSSLIPPELACTSVAVTG
jgi:hypothetical protein